MNWHPSREDVKRLMKMVKVHYTLHVLEEQQEAISKETFTEDGLYLVLLTACQFEATDVVEHFLDKHSKLFDINETFRYGYTQEWSRPVNYVTLIEDTISFIDEKQEERSDNLTSFTRKYCKNDATEVIQLLQKYGAN